MNSTDEGRKMWSRRRSAGPGLSSVKDTLLVPLRPAGGDRAFFLVPAGLGTRSDLAAGEGQFLPYIRLIHALGENRPVYGLRRPVLASLPQSSRTVEYLAARYAEAVLSMQPQGPHLVVGHCVGGLFALEAARQLSVRRSEVAVVLLDTAFPDGSYRQHLSEYIHFHENVRADGASITKKVQENWNQLVAMQGGMIDRLRYAAGRLVSFLQYRLSAERQVWEEGAREQLLFLELVQDYEPRPYNGRVLLVATDEWYEAGFEDAWEKVAVDAWEKVAVNGLEFCRIPGRHDFFLRESAHIVSTIITKFATAKESPLRMYRNGSLPNV